MKINIISERNEGKTSLAIGLFKILKMFGYNVELIGSNRIHTEMLNEFVPKCDSIEHLRDTKIEIVDEG